jgi:hypothetical protein
LVLRCVIQPKELGFPGAPKMILDRMAGLSQKTKHGVMAGGAMGFYGLN